MRAYGDDDIACGADGHASARLMEMEMEQGKLAFTAVYLRSDHGYVGFLEELPGVNSHGRTLEEAREALRMLTAVVFDEERRETEELIAGKEVVRETHRCACGARDGPTACASARASPAGIGPRAGERKSYYLERHAGARRHSPSGSAVRLSASPLTRHAEEIMVAAGACPPRRASMEGGRMRNGLRAGLREIVMGLRWHARKPGSGASRQPANLDAQCVMFDKEHRVLEVVYPGHLRNANGSVLHTGDSRTGGGEWDSERIFVFLEALPDAVCALALVVKSADGRGFGEVPGAWCHVSDRVAEHECLQLDLTALGNRKEHRVATLRRGPAGWQITPLNGRQAHHADL